MSFIVEVRGLKKSFRKGFWLKSHTVLKGVTFSLQPGTITGFLGSNGTGKTTTIKSLLGLVYPEEGEVLFFGTPGLDAEKRRRIGFLPESPYFYDYLSGREFLRFYARLSLTIASKAVNSAVEDMLKLVGLTHAADRALRTYSKGMLQRVGLAQALIHKPELVILDEPMTGLDPDGRQEISEIIRRVCNEGAAVFFSSHLLHDAETLCDRIVILRDGIVAYEGGTEALLSKLGSSYRVQATKGSERRSVDAADLSTLQAEIDRQRSEGFNITDVRFQRTSLEDAYRDVVKNDVKNASRPEAIR